MAPERQVEMGSCNQRKQSSKSNPVSLVNRTYTTRKTVAQGMLDIALLLANGSQLKALLQTPESYRDVLYIPQLVLIGLSVTLQICVGILIIILGNMEIKTEEAQKKAIIMNNTTVALILFITITNVFISAFGIKVSSNEYVYSPTEATPQVDLETYLGNLTTQVQT